MAFSNLFNLDFVIAFNLFFNLFNLDFVIAFNSFLKILSIHFVIVYSKSICRLPGLEAVIGREGPARTIFFIKMPVTLNK